MLSGYKTYIAAAVAVVTAVAQYLSGDTTVAQTLQLVFTAVLGATLRGGIAKI